MPSVNYGKSFFDLHRMYLVTYFNQGSTPDSFITDIFPHNSFCSNLCLNIHASTLYVFLTICFWIYSLYIFLMYMNPTSGIRGWKTKLKLGTRIKAEYFEYLLVNIFTIKKKGQNGYKYLIIVTIYSVQLGQKRSYYADG